MHNKISLLLLIVIFLSQTLSAQKKYDREYFAAFPTPYEAAAVYFYTHTDALKYTFLEKRYDGWYAKEHEILEEKKLEETKTTKIWDAIQQRYEEGMQTNYPNDLPSNVLLKVKRVDEYNACLFPFYGYETAEKETIELLETVPVEELNAAELEALVRAYSESLKKKLTRPDKFEYFILPYDTTYKKSDLSKATMLECRKLAKKSIEYAELLIQKYPNYKTIVGDIRMKVANDQMDYYRIFSELQYTRWAKQFINKASYAPFALEKAKNYLRNCPRNAILLTYGDNDTYPLIYVQKKLNFRKDVKVLNSSLISLGRCIYNNTTHSKSGELKVTLDIQHYMIDRNNVISFKGNSSKDVQHLLEQINEDKAIFYGLKTRWIHFPDLVNIISATDTILIQHPGSYWLKDELFLLDLIVSNWPQRPICFVPFRKQSFYTALLPYLEQQGFVAQLTNEMHTNFPTNRSFCPINIKKTERWLLETASFKQLSEEDLENPSYFPFLHTCMGLYHELVSIYIENEDHKNAIRLLGHLDQVLPAEKFDYGWYHLQFATIYSLLDKEAKSKAHCAAYLQELKERYQQGQIPVKEQSVYQRWSKLPNMNRLQSEVQFLQKFVTEQDWPELLKEIENWRD